MESNIKKRIDWIDLTKGFAILLVILGHCLEWYSSKMGAKLFLLPIIYSFHVPIFFFISGFLYSNKNQKFSNHLLKISKSLLLPYFTFAVITVLFDAVKIYILHTEDNVTVLGSIKGFLIQEHYSTLWFIACLFFVEITAFFICKIKNNRLILCIACAFAIAATLYNIYIHKLLPWCIDEILYAMPFFLGGYLVKACNLSDKILKLKYLPIFIVFGIFFAILNMQLTPNMTYPRTVFLDYGIVPLYYLSAFFNIFSAITICKKINRINFINYFGANSLVYFGLHILVLHIIFHFTSSSNYENPLIYCCVCIFVTAIITLIMTIVNIVLVKTPLCVLIGKNYQFRRNKNENN